MESIDISNVKFDEKGLVPCVVQDYYTKQVLMLAYMNRESLIKTMETGLATFYSRSRQELWTKGATSGNLQHVVELRLDCDGDAIVAEVKKDGPACHTGNESCFYRDLFVGNDMKPFSIEGLYELIKGRKTNPKEGSYTTYLFEEGGRGMYRSHYRGQSRQPTGGNIRTCRFVLSRFGHDGGNGYSAERRFRRACKPPRFG